MPKVLDKVVVNTASDLSGNGGRKIVRLNNGWLSSVLYDSTAKVLKIYVSKDNGNTWTMPKEIGLGGSQCTGWSIETKGNYLYVLSANATAGSVVLYTYNYLLDSNITYSTPDSSQSSLGSVSLVINESGTEIHATWASRNGTYSVSDNIRYAKGTISQVDGSVEWSTVVQVTKNQTSGQNMRNPAIVLKADGNPIVVYEYMRGNTVAEINCADYNGTSWTSRVVIFDNGYNNFYPTVIFVPQRVNGLPNGRILVSWQNVNTYARPMVAYSDDAGVTWVSKELNSTSGNRVNMSLTANGSNEIFVVYEHKDSGLIRMYVNKGGTWGSEVILDSGINPSTIFDPTFSLSFAEPLVVYTKSPNVIFRGIWTTSTTTLLSPEGSLILKFKPNLNGETISKLNTYLNGIIMETYTTGLENEFTYELNEGDLIHNGTDVFSVEYVDSTDKSWGSTAIRVYKKGVAKDITVVGQPMSTGFNGGKKIVRLSNKWIITALVNSNVLNVLISKDNGNNWTLLGTSSLTSIQDWAMVTDGTRCYLVLAFNNANVASYSFDGTNGIGGMSVFETSQTALGGVSLAINEAKTELHATLASKNGNYPSSFNIRYAKVTIGASGDLLWGAVEQVTKANSVAINFKNPTITLNGRNAANIQVDSDQVVFDDGSSNSSPSIINLYKGGTPTYTYVSSGWGHSLVFNGNAYTQASPSAIFVPQSVNGLANGRIWVAWHGTDSTDTQANNLRISYSDDGGVTWSAMQKLTTGNDISRHSLNPSITANLSNEIYVVYDEGSATKGYDVAMISSINNVWGSREVVKDRVVSNVQSYPSTLFDMTTKFTKPIFVYRDNSKVGYYGTLKLFTAQMNLTLPNPTNVKTKENIDYIRDKVNAFRLENGLSAYSWAEPIIIKKVTPIKSSHWNEIEEAILEVYNSTQEPIISSPVKQSLEDRSIAKVTKLTDLPDRVDKILKGLQNVS